MRKLLLIIALVTFSFISIVAQNNFTQPNHKKLTKELSGRKAGVYDVLMQRYLSHDTTLSPGDYHLLYYGHALQPGYNPGRESSLRDSLNHAFKDNSSTDTDYEKIRSLAVRVLQDLPFDIRALDPAIHASEMLGDKNMADALEFKMGRLIETIFTSGDGLTQQTPFYVVSVANETDLIRALGFHISSTSAAQSQGLRFWPVAENEFGIKGFYFKMF